MVSMLDCIARVPQIIQTILDGESSTYTEALARVSQALPNLDELVFIGSGTSYTSSFTARHIAEKASGIRVTVMTPDEFVHQATYRNPNAFYLFCSQTGTSIVTGEALAVAKELGFLTAALSEAPDTPIAQQAHLFIDMHCGKEEYPMRTIGYSSTVLTLSLLAAKIGLQRGHLNAAEYDEYKTSALAAAQSIPQVIQKAMAWLDVSRRAMMRAECIALTGSGPLYGVALEGAVKIWETPQIVAVGYELEEGIHGPNYGYSQNHSVIVLNAGGYDSQKAIALARYMRNEKQNGYIVGVGAESDTDLAFEPKGGIFCCLEFASVVQVLAYRLAVDGGRDLFAPHDNRVMHSYFMSHHEEV